MITATDNVKATLSSFGTSHLMPLIDRNAALTDKQQPISSAVAALT
jgi:hypothetical protein